MIEPIEWLRALLIHYPYFEYIIIFLGAGFGGEFAILTLGFLAAQNVITIYPLFLFGFFGVLFADSLWFIIGRTAVLRKIMTHRYANTTVEIINEAITRVSRGNHLLALIIAKFLVGTRVLLILYVATTDIKFKQFIRYDVISIVIWIVVLVGIGFLSGYGFTYFAQILENIYAAIGFILLIILIVMILQIWLKRRFTKKI